MPVWLGFTRCINPNTPPAAVTPAMDFQLQLPNR